jgi:hypothetical protein
LAASGVFVAGASAVAQVHHPPDPKTDPAAVPVSLDTLRESERDWRFDIDGNAFIGLNYQRRLFRDFHEVESQNWMMLGARRTWGRTSTAFFSMLSFEPFTIQNLGSPQVFQTGETYEGAPLIDYQHPHDLIMALGGHAARPIATFELRLDAAVVGSPALGPPVFMHRPSARDNPQAPLSHHNLDSTHITHGVVTAGVFRAGVGLEVSAFRGREPDEDRLDLDLGPLDSWAARASWKAGRVKAQFSGARLRQPETIHPYDVARITASVSYEGPLAARPVAIMAAWGQNREAVGIFDAYMVEAHVQLTDRRATYLRGELVTKSILGGGFHPPGAVHHHPHSRISALTGGYVHDLAATALGRFGIGGDVTIYGVPANLEESYGRPLSFHAFLRYRPTRVTTSHVHH